MTYLLDSNVFIQAKNMHYGFDFCPAFWEWTEKNNADGLVYSVDAVRNELLDIEDELADWVRPKGGSFFLEPDDRVTASIRESVGWLIRQPYLQAAKDAFLAVADFILIAHAHAYNYTVVTHEKPAPLSRKSIKIPDVCAGVGVAWVSPFQMLRAESARFVLGVV